jgi:hypothetical protein
VFKYNCLLNFPSKEKFISNSFIFPLETAVESIFQIVTYFNLSENGFCKNSVEEIFFISLISFLLRDLLTFSQ